MGDKTLWAVKTLCVVLVALLLVNITVIKPLSRDLTLAEFTVSVLRDEIDKLEVELVEAYDACPEDTYCYKPYGAPIEAEYVMTGSLVIIRWTPEDQMPDGVEAFAEWEVDYENNFSACVITATPPQQVLGDPRMDALGHELLHCLIGNFHP